MSDDERQMAFSGLPTPEIPEPDVLAVRSPLWTEHKAHLISRYLYFFVLVTHHGTYFDGFSGPQELDRPEMWSAKLVLEMQPRWMRTFHLFEADPAQVERLRAMVAAQRPHDSKKREPRRTIRIYPGDFNEQIGAALQKTPVKPREAAFALLDQRTFECRWSTVQTIARHKTSGTKIELFYFLAAG
jgi:three-Cys-motif partner protein